MANSHKLTTIAVSQEVKVAIAKRGTAGMSYNDVILNLLEDKKQANTNGGLE